MMEKPLPPPLKKHCDEEPEPGPPPPIGCNTLEALSWVEDGGRTQDDPRERTRIVPMEVLVLGMPRTGTFSMKAALQHLGLKGTYHMESCIANPPDAHMWAEAMKWKLEGKGRPFTRKDWDQLLGHTQAILDYPGCVFLPELLEAYPEAKLIVIERDVDSWYRSMQNTVLTVMPKIWDIPLFFLDTEFYVQWGQMMKPADGFFGGNMADPAKAKPAYHAIFAEVRGLVPEGERRLEYKLGQGWAPLEKFLGRKAPKGLEFPFINEGKDFVAASTFMKARAWQRVRWTVLQFLLRLVVIAVVALGPLLFVPKELFTNLGSSG